MNTSGIEQVTYLQFLEVSSLPAASQRLKNTEVVLRTDGQKYRCTGTGWVNASGGSTVGSLDANSPIAGNPAGLQTPAELAATLQAQAAEIAALQAQTTTLQSFKTNNDQDNNNVVDTTDNLEVHAPDYVSQFNTGLLP